ncbi:MAG: ParA family protein [Bryobacterales bacterium]|nr:ParA family protein [Bryobacterales bacterium]
MQVVALASEKGGSGKTTLACSLSVVGAQGGLSVALVDADPQGSAAAWGARREVLIGPDVVHVPLASVPDAVEAARERYDLVLLDTPGQATASNKALACADLVLVPCRPTIPDIEVAARAHATASRVAAAAAFVVVQVPGRGEKRAQATDDALSELGPVAPVRVGFRNAFADAVALGLGVTEFQPRSKAASEMLDLWMWTTGRLKEVP